MSVFNKGDEKQLSARADAFTCPCGSVVKATNKKAHERTKRHTNFVGAGTAPLRVATSQPAVRGQKPLLPPPPLPTRSRNARARVEDHAKAWKEDEREEDYDSQEDGDEVDDAELEDELDDEHDDDEEDDELIMAVEHLVEGQHLISEQVQNLHSSVPLSFEGIRKRLDEVEANILKNLKEFVSMYNEHRASDKQLKTQQYINDKCTPAQ
jgi:hypothetical protein